MFLHFRGEQRGIRMLARDVVIPKKLDGGDNNGICFIQLARTAGRATVTSLAIRGNRLAGNAV